MIVLRGKRPLKNSIPGYGWFKHFNEVFPYRPFILNTFQRDDPVRKEKNDYTLNNKQTYYDVEAFALFFLYNHYVW